MNNIKDKLERFTTSRTSIICSTFREGRIRNILIKALSSGNVDDFNTIIKGLIKIRNESRKLYKISRNIEDRYLDKIIKIVDEDKENE